MSIENTLERIATALEKIVEKCGVPSSTAGLSKDVVDKAKASAAKITEEIREKQKGIRTDEKVEELAEEPEATEELQEVEPESTVKWADVNKAFFGALTKIKATVGLDKAKEVSAKLSKKYSGGSPPSASNTDPSKYGKFLADIEAALKENVKNG